MSNSIKIQRYHNSVKVKGINRRINIFKQLKDDKEINTIYISSLVSETSKELGGISYLSTNNKIKHTLIGLSNDAIEELYACLHYYLNGNIKP